MIKKKKKTTPLQSPLQSQQPGLTAEALGTVSSLFTLARVWASDPRLQGLLQASPQQPHPLAHPPSAEDPGK